jgi:hypothetical protein
MTSVLNYIDSSGGTTLHGGCLSRRCNKPLQSWRKHYDLKNMYFNYRNFPMWLKLLITGHIVIQTLFIEMARMNHSKV